MEIEEIKKLEAQAIDLINNLSAFLISTGLSMEEMEATADAISASEVAALKIQTLFDGGLVTVRPPRNN